MRREALRLAATCLLGGSFAVTAATPPAETQRLRSVSAALAATRPVVVNEAAMKRLAASPAPLPAWMTPAQRTELRQIAELAARGDTASVGRRWKTFVLGWPASTVPSDPNALVQWVLRESYLEQTKDLAEYAEKVKYLNDVKAGLREEIRKAQSLKPVAQAQGSVSLQAVTGLPAFRKVATPGVPSAARGAGHLGALPTLERTFTPAQLDQYVRSLEAYLRSVGDDAQLANVDLQSVLQKQQQVLQMMSNVSKMIYDTSMAVVRKIGG